MKSPAGGWIGTAIAMAAGAVAGIALAIGGVLLMLDWPGLWDVLGWSLL